jgi:methylmalonyl-CoA/ethylmalonyl-CoA epimerase
MAKLRHLAIFVPDPEASAVFFEHAFEMKRVAAVPGVLYVSDGTVNVALIKAETPEEKVGIDHFGMWVDDLDDARRKAVEAGATPVGGPPPQPGAFYETKFRDANGIVFDISHTGWAGAVKDVAPVATKQG